VNVPQLARGAFVREKEVAQPTITKDDRHPLPRAIRTYTCRV
jgi:hypothetical protein